MYVCIYLSFFLLSNNDCSCFKQRLMNSIFCFQYKTYKFSKGNEGYYSFVFNDIMGMERTKGIHVEDVKLALRGHVKDDYEVESFDLWLWFICLVFWFCLFMFFGLSYMGSYYLQITESCLHLHFGVTMFSFQMYGI